MRNKQAAILGAIVLVMGFCGGMWFLFHRQMTNPDNRIGVQVVEIPVEQVKVTSGKALPLEEGETITVEVMPDRSQYSAIVNPLGFMVLMFAVLIGGTWMLWRVN